MAPTMFLDLPRKIRDKNYQYSLLLDIPKKDEIWRYRIVLYTTPFQ